MLNLTVLCSAVLCFALCLHLACVNYWFSIVIFCFKFYYITNMFCLPTQKQCYVVQQENGFDFHAVGLGVWWWANKAIIYLFWKTFRLQFNLDGQQSEQESLALGTIRATLFFPVGSNQSYHLNSLKATKASLPYLRSNQSYDLISMLDGPIRCTKPRVICQLENIEWISSSSSTRGFSRALECSNLRPARRPDGFQYTSIELN